MLQLRDLEVALGERRLVGPLDLELEAGECLAVLGASGAGKSLLGRAILGLLPRGLEHRGEISFQGHGLRSQGDWKTLRGAQIAWLPQESTAALSPTRRVGEQVAEVARRHLDLDRHAARHRCAELFDELGLQPAERLLEAWPHQLSGGQAQRALLAAALIARPRLLIVDEPSSALDARATTAVLEGLQRACRSGAAVLLISHDLEVAASADRLLVMLAGQVVEEGPAAACLASPRHPFLADLLAARHGGLGQRPPLQTAEDGCPYRLDCERAEDSCHQSPGWSHEPARRWRCPLSVDA